MYNLWNSKVSEDFSVNCQSNEPFQLFRSTLRLLLAAAEITVGDVLQLVTQLLMLISYSYCKGTGSLNFCKCCGNSMECTSLCVKIGRKIGAGPLIGWISVRCRLGSLLSEKNAMFGQCLIATLLPTINETFKWLTSLPILLQNHSGGDSVAIGLVSFLLPAPSPGILVLASTSLETSRN